MVLRLRARREAALSPSNHPPSNTLSPSSLSLSLFIRFIEFKSAARELAAEYKHIVARKEPPILGAFKYTKPSHKLLERRGSELQRSLRR